MADIQHQRRSDPLVTLVDTASDTPAAASTAPRPKGPPRPRQPSIHQIYSQPAPLRVFPFPTLTPNPVSWVHLAVAWLGQVFYPPPIEPSNIHTAYWDHETRSLIVTDEKSMADLWRQGFYGKGNLSRSEPNWLKRENIRQGVFKGKVSEVNTDKRREDRTRVKWERARLEQEALEQRRHDEARALVEAATATVEAAALEVEAVVAEIATALPTVPISLERLPPVGPQELLALPNSHLELLALPKSHVELAPPKVQSVVSQSPVGPLQLLALPNSAVELVARSRTSHSEDTDYGTTSVDESGSSGNDDADSNTTASSDSTGLKRRKSVRFSPTVESNFFLHTDPPSPPRSVSFSTVEPQSALASKNVAVGEDHQSLQGNLRVASQVAAEAVASVEVPLVNKEHLQLAPEEAFFLAYALGALRVVDKVTRAVIPTADLLTLLRQQSYFPPRTSGALQPDDPFLIHYAVYHHFRSLGWVPRPGVKFGVDWMLYNRGPVFDHAEYGLQVLPSYSHPHWKAEGRQGPKKSWHWLMGVNRVLSKVYKSLVLVYVDIPPPSAFSANGEPENGLTDILKQYAIREQMVKRWSSNRNRDL